MSYIPPQRVHSTTFDLELRNKRFTFIPFMGFPAILSTLQPVQICICNRKNRKFTFSNGPQLMGKGSMANLHASLDSTCKSRISQISTRYQIRGSIPQLFIQNSEMNLKICPNLMGSISELLILSSEMNFFHSQEGLNPHAIHILHLWSLELKS